MIAIDGSPLVFGPFSVARMLEGWLAGWPGLDEPDGPLLLLPSGDAPAGFPPEHVRRDDKPSPNARRFRSMLAGHVVGARAQGLLAPWMAVPDLRPFDVPVVAMVHELPWVRHGPIEGRRRMWSQKLWLQRITERCAALLVPSEATRDDLVRAKPGLDERIRLVPHGFDPAPWKAARRAPDDPPYALMLGVGAGRAHARKKGLDVLLEAWPQAGLEGWRLVLVGEPALRVPAGVEVHAARTGDALTDLVAGASMLVYPSRMEGFGFPPLEAMAAGVPVLATNAGSVPEVVGDAAHVVPAGDVVALVEGLRRVALDEMLRIELQARGAAQAHAFPVETAAARIVEAFATLGVRA